VSKILLARRLSFGILKNYLFNHKTGGNYVTRKKKWKPFKSIADVI